ncbi:MAG: CheR family methyltransferase, partial [Bryocella sp.]
GQITAFAEPPAALLNELTASAAATAGMAPAILDRRSVRQTLRRRIEASRVHNAEEYVTLYRRSEEERGAFLEGILNNETCFFRDAAVFEEMRRWCVEWFALGARSLRVLSAPCSTGEEPYSIAAMLLDAGVELERFTIDAIDLSGQALELAQQAEYTGMALRNVPEPDQAAYFERGERGWRVKQELRDKVRFSQANLLEESALAEAKYDLVCSRNLLIYQTPEARKRVAQALARTLAPRGRLVLGAADWGRDLEELFELEKPVASFALRLRKPRDVAHEVMRSPSPTNEAVATTNEAVATTTVRRLPRSVASGDELAHLSAIYRRALEAFASGNDREAERLCRQALYLDNNHLPSLELLAKIRRPNLTERMEHALRVRLGRHRAAAQAGAV